MHGIFWPLIISHVLTYSFAIQVPTYLSARTAAARLTPPLRRIFHATMMTGGARYAPGDHTHIRPSGQGHRPRNAHAAALSDAYHILFSLQKVTVSQVPLIRPRYSQNSTTNTRAEAEPAYFGRHDDDAALISWHAHSRRNIFLTKI